MIDTIAATTIPRSPLADNLFAGGVVQTDFGDDDNTVQARLWLNAPEGEYAPRVTYWRGAYAERTGAGLAQMQPIQRANADGEVMDDRGFLKIEFSVPKMLGLSPVDNVSQVDVEKALDAATSFVRSTFGDDFAHVSGWRCQRVDYAWNFEVGRQLSAYMSVLDKLRLKAYSRHPFEAHGGVVWKSRSTRGRWVKFYNKTREAKLKHKDETLRFEISNFSKSIPYMSAEWFGCEREVGQMVGFGRALYMMARVWDDLGLGSGEPYGHEEWMDVRLRDAFGKRQLPKAAFVLRCIERYGTACFSEDIDLLPKTTYYRWRRLLSEQGLLTTVRESDDAHDTVNYEPLPALHLPYTSSEDFCELVGVQNLKELFVAQPIMNEKNFAEFLAEKLEIKRTAKPSDYLIRRLGEGMLQNGQETAA